MAEEANKNHTFSHQNKVSDYEEEEEKYYRDVKECKLFGNFDGTFDARAFRLYEKRAEKKEGKKLYASMDNLEEVVFAEIVVEPADGFFTSTVGMKKLSTSTRKERVIKKNSALYTKAMFY